MHYIYHYYASLQEGAKLLTIDGIVDTPVPITTMERYQEVKEVILKDSIKPLPPNGWAIRSLSLLHTVEDVDFRNEVSLRKLQK